MWVNDRWPDDWTKSIYIPVHKKGIKDICDDYSTLAVTSKTRKVMLEIISGCIKPYLLSQNRPVPGRGTIEQILYLRQVIGTSR